jgi:hypothetical protein
MRIRRAVVTTVAAVAVACDAKGRVATAYFAAGFVMCQVAYDHAGIVEMDNRVPGDHERLVYVRLAGGFFVHKTMTFPDHPGGELRDLVSHHRPIEAHQNETTIRDQFERY